MSFVFSSKKKKGAEVESERKKTSSHLAVQAVLRVHPQLRLALPPELRDLPRIGKGRRRLPQPSVDEVVDPRGAVSGLGTAKDRRADGRRGFRVFEFEMRRLVVVVVDPRAGEGFGQREGDPVVRRRVAGRRRGSFGGRRSRGRRRREWPRRGAVAALGEAVPQRPGGPAAEEVSVEGRGDHAGPEPEVEAG